MSKTAEEWAAEYNASLDHGYIEDLKLDFAAAMAQARDEALEEVMDIWRTCDVGDFGPLLRALKDKP